MPTDDLDATMARVRKALEDGFTAQAIDAYDLLSALTTLRAEHERAMAVVEALPTLATLHERDTARAEADSWRKRAEAAEARQQADLDAARADAWDDGYAARALDDVVGGVRTASNPYR